MLAAASDHHGIPRQTLKFSLPAALGTTSDTQKPALGAPALASNPTDTLGGIAPGTSHGLGQLLAAPLSQFTDGKLALCRDGFSPRVGFLALSSHAVQDQPTPPSNSPGSAVLLGRS